MPDHRTSSSAIRDINPSELRRRTPDAVAVRCCELIALAFRAEDAIDTRLQELSIGMVNVVRSGDLIKLLWWDGDGLCLFAKRLERGRFIWPQAESGTVSLTGAQLSMLLEGIDWRRPARTWKPDLAV